MSQVEIVSEPKVVIPNTNAADTAKSTKKPKAKKANTSKVKPQNASNIKTIFRNNNFDVTYNEDHGSFKVMNRSLSPNSQDKSIFFNKFHKLEELSKILADIVNKHNSEVSVAEQAKIEA